MKRFASILIGGLCVLVLSFGVVAASGAQSRTWINDFERVGDDTPSNDWWTDPPATSTRTQSGAAATYASGIQLAHGRWHVRMRPNEVCPKSPAGPICFGSYTFWGKGGSSTNPVFPQHGYVTEIDIYLDKSWMTQDPLTRFDTRFDWDSSINDQSGGFRRDFIFNAGTPLTPSETASTPGFYVNASTNGNRSGAFPENSCPSPATPPNYCRAPVKITESGWYTFRHYFHLVNLSGITYLAVDMSIRRNDTVVPGASWTIYDQQDVRGFGGDAYGWFVINEFQDLAADCAALHPPGMVHPRLYAPCRFVRGGEEGDRCDRNNESNQVEQDQLDHVNRERSAALLPPLTMNTTSSNVARDHSCDERNHGDPGERGSDGSMSADRMRAAGVAFVVNAENNGVAEATTAAEALGIIQSDFVDEATSTANMLNPAFTQVGIGAVYSNGVLWLTEDFTG